MRDSTTRTPDIGALGPKLLYEDDSIQHAGMYFTVADPGSRSGRTRTTSRACTGLPGRERRPAGAGGHGRLHDDRPRALRGARRPPGDYVQGDYEDSDLCLRLIEAGRENWYLPGRRALPPRGTVVHADLRLPANRYNVWLHTRIVGRPDRTARERHRTSSPLRPLTEITEVLPAAPGGALAGFRSTPPAGAADTDALDLRGWVVGGRSPAPRCWFCAMGYAPPLPLEVHRPDVAAFHPGLPGRNAAGSS